MDFTFTEHSTSRLTIRKLRQDDCDDLMEIYADADVVVHWGMHPLVHKTDIDKIISSADLNFKKGQSISLGIIENETQTLVGILLMFNLNEASVLSQKFACIQRVIQDL